jgi:DNA-binding transcriptional regulator YhcF (GntR family)
MLQKLDKKSGIPLYIQVKNKIERDIRSQSLTAGQKLPTERELATMLGTSRNTITAAYRLLEQEGYLQCHQGRGTFVASEDAGVEELDLKGRLATLVDQGLEEAWQAGLTTIQFIEMVQARVQEKEEEKRRVKAVFVECNIEQAKVFSKELEEYSHFTVKPMVLTDITPDNEKALKQLKEARIIFTTFSHLPEMREHAQKLGKDVFGMAIKPNLEGLVKIARYPKTTKFAVISLSLEFHQKFKRNLTAAGLDGLVMTYTTATDKSQVKKVIEGVDVIIASPGRCEETKKLVNGEKEVIVFNTTLDTSSVKAALLRISDQLS